MKKALILFALSSISLASCAEPVRYSPEEIKEFPPVIQERIKSGEISTGMTQQQVRFAWGSPATINILGPSLEGKKREEWIYSRGIGIFKTHLIFTDGKITEIITSEPGVIKK